LEGSSESTNSDDGKGGKKVTTRETMPIWGIKHCMKTPFVIWECRSRLTSIRAVEEAQHYGYGAMGAWR
jgi:hypothetical protein